jgi:predicted transcriptional regulator YheO
MKNIGLMIRNMVQYEQDQKDLLNDKFNIDSNSIENNIFQILYDKVQTESDDVLKNTSIDIVKMLKDKGFI